MKDWLMGSITEPRWQCICGFLAWFLFGINLANGIAYEKQLRKEKKARKARLDSEEERYSRIASEKYCEELKESEEEA